MKNHFVSYDKTAFDGDNNQNMVFEMMSICIADGTRIIIEQNPKYGIKYLMVDFSPTDNSNPECETFNDCGLVCVVSSVDGDNEGQYDEGFTNYLDACNWISNFIREGDFTEIYLETY